MTMQYLWRPLGLCTLAAALWIGVPSQANADASDMGPGTLLVARNDQQYNGGQDSQYHRDGKAAKVKNNGKNASKKDAKGNAYGKSDSKMKGKGLQAGSAGDHKGTRGDKVAGPNAKKAKADKAVQPSGKKAKVDKVALANAKNTKGNKVAQASGKKAKGDKAARPNNNRTGKRTDAQRQAPQHSEGEVNN